MLTAVIALVMAAAAAASMDITLDRLGIDPAYRNDTEMAIAKIIDYTKIEEKDVDVHAALYGAVLLWYLDYTASELPRLKSTIQYLVAEKKASATKLINHKYQVVRDLDLSSTSTPLDEELLDILTANIKTDKDCNGWTPDSQLILETVQINQKSYLEKLMRLPCGAKVTARVFLNTRINDGKYDALDCALRLASPEELELAISMLALQGTNNNWFDRVKGRSEYEEVVKRAMNRQAQITKVVQDNFNTSLKNTILYVDNWVKITSFNTDLIDFMKDLAKAYGISNFFAFKAVEHLDSLFASQVATHLVEARAQIVIDSMRKSNCNMITLKKVLQLPQMDTVSPVSLFKYPSHDVSLGEKLAGNLNCRGQTVDLEGLWKTFFNYSDTANTSHGRQTEFNRLTDSAYFAGFLRAVHDPSTIGRLTPGEIQTFTDTHIDAIAKMYLPIGSTEDPETFIKKNVELLINPHRHMSDQTQTNPPPATKQSSSESSGIVPNALIALYVALSMVAVIFAV